MQDIIKQHNKNTRASKMWNIITNHVEFEEKTVADFGCGYGDFIWRAIDAGANAVFAFDKEQKFEIIMPYDIQIRFLESNLDELVDDEFHPKYDIGFCFSVLPYLDRPRLFLSWMARNTKIALIESQYSPEPYNIGVENDDDMLSLLHNRGFKFMLPIGKTHIKNRDTYRTIWMCT